MKNKMKHMVITCYLDYVNNFLTIERFAEHYEITEDQAKIIIKLGKEFGEVCKNDVREYLKEISK